VAGHLPARTIPTEQIEDTPERVVVILHGTKLAGRAELIAHPDGWTVRFNSG